MSPLQSASFPFANADLTKVWGDFRLPLFNVEAFLEAHRKNAAAWATANEVAFDGLKALAQRQADLILSTAGGCGKVAGEVLAAASLEEKAAKQSDAARHVYVSAVAGFTELSDIAVKANTAASDILNARITAAFDEFKALFDVPAANVVAAAAAPLAVPAEQIAIVEQVAAAEAVPTIEEASPAQETVAAVQPEPIVSESTVTEPIVPVPMSVAPTLSSKTSRRPNARR